MKPSRDIQSRLGGLPSSHVAGLRAAVAGFDDAQIALLLGVPLEAVRPTLRLAAAKLVTALAEPQVRPERGGGDLA